MPARGVSVARNTKPHGVDAAPTQVIGGLESRPRVCPLIQGLATRVGIKVSAPLAPTVIVKTTAETVPTTAVVAVYISRDTYSKAQRPFATAIVLNSTSK